MFGKKLFTFAFMLLALLIQACAQPKYETVVKSPDGESGPDSTQEKASSCSLKLSSSGYCLTWQWETMPTSTALGSIVFKVFRGNLYDDSLVPVDFEIQPVVVLWMPSMGHGSSPTVVHPLDLGTYRASNVFFVMPGDWEIRFQMKEGATVRDEAVVSLSI